MFVLEDEGRAVQSRVVKEAAIEKRACREIKKLWPGAETRKLNGAGDRGWPDRLVVLPRGVLLMIEFKRPGAGLSPAQRSKIKRITKLGHNVYVCDSVREAVRACEVAFAIARTL